MIFISYRRKDSAYFTGRLADRLMDRFGRHRVFLDVGSIAGGEDFLVSMDSNISKCQVALVIIGYSWLEELAKRSEDDLDHVRNEISCILQSENRILAIPLYLDESLILNHASKLPPSIERLRNLNARVVRPGLEFDDDVARIIRECERRMFPSFALRTLYRLQRFASRSRGWLIAIGLSILIIWSYRDQIASQVLLSRYGVPHSLSRFDPEVFSKKKQNDALYVGRLLVDRATLASDTDLAKAIRETKRTLDIHSIAGTAFLNDDENLRKILREGVRIRLLLVDHSDENRVNLDNFFGGRANVNFDFSESRGKLEMTLQRVARIRRELNNARSGSIDVKLWRGVYWNSFWIRDSQLEEHAIGHIEIGFHGDLDKNPSMRFGRLGMPLISNLQSQFDLMWNRGNDVE